MFSTELLCIVFKVDGVGPDKMDDEQDRAASNSHCLLSISDMVCISSKEIGPVPRRVLRLAYKQNKRNAKNSWLSLLSHYFNFDSFSLYNLTK